MSKLLGNIADFLVECWEEKGMGIAVYLAVCGGAANIFVLWWAIRWCIEHIRVV